MWPFSNSIWPFSSFRKGLSGSSSINWSKAGLALARELLVLMDQVVKTLEAEKKLPDAVEIRAAKVVKNPF